MPYIGNNPVGGGFHKLDNLTASSTATYALTLGSAAYYPETANQLLVSLNGVIQAPQDSFTVSGSNLIFDSALTASDSIDFVVALGDVLGVQGVTDGTVTTNKIANGAVTAAKLAAGAVGGAGSIAQVQFTQLTTDSTLSLAAKTDTVVTGFTVNITPKSTTSIIKVEAMWFGEMLDTPNTYSHMFFFYADTTKLGYTGAASNRNYGVAPATRTYSGVDNTETPDVANLSFFHAPNTTSQVTYKLGVNVDSADTLYINRTIGSSDIYNHQRGTSFICVTEILQ